MSETAGVRVRVLGGLSVEGVAERELGSRKARTLLKVLALARGTAVPVDRLADILWGDELPARPADQIGVLVSRLRGVLGADRLVRTDSGYAMDVDWLDADELATRTAEAADALAAGRLGAARAAAHAALALARGPVLPEEEGEWVEIERSVCVALVGSARRVTAEAAAQGGDHLTAVTAAEDALAHDPYDEAALRVLMRAHVAARRPASALAAYVRVRDRLVEDLGVSPTAETEALHDAIVVEEERSPSVDSIAGSLPGRDAELKELEAALDRAAAGSTPAVIAVVGEAGIGKTALVEHWCRAIQMSAFALIGRCDALGRDLPLQPIADAVAARLGTLDEPTRLAALGADTSVLGPLLGVASGTATVVSDPELGRARLFSALLTLISELAGGRVVVLVVDDLHLAGDSTVAWLRFAVRRPSRLLVVITSRPTTATQLESAATIELGPLDIAAATVLVGEGRAAALHARSGGHPLLLTALAASDDDARPSTVHEAIVRRLESLGDAAGTLRAAAVLGTDVDLDLLADILRLPAVELLGDLEVAAAAGLLVERGGGFSFKHDLERESLALGAGAARRALVHRDAARALASRGAPDPLVVAVHARLGGDLDLAIESFTRAAGVAVARHDVDAATTHLDAALALGEAPMTLATRARLRMATGHLDAAADDAARAVAGGAGAAAFEVSGWVAYYRRRYEEALAFADAALERSTDPALRVSCLSLAGRVHHSAGRVVEASDRLETAMSVDAPPEVRALAGVWLAQARAHAGRPADALALLDRALVDPDRIAHPFAPLHGRFTRVMALGQLGRADEALHACDEFEAEIVRRGDVGVRMVAPAANVRAWILRWTGRTAEADELNHAAVASSDPEGVRSEAYYAGLLDLADGRLLAGDDAAVGALLERLAPIEAWNGTMAWHQRHRWLLLRARLALRDGDMDGAAELSAAVTADAGARGAARYEALAAAVGVLAGGDDANAEAIVARLRMCAALDGAPLVAALTARAR